VKADLIVLRKKPFLEGFTNFLEFLANDKFMDVITPGSLAVTLGGNPSGALWVIAALEGSKGRRLAENALSVWVKFSRDERNKFIPTCNIVNAVRGKVLIKCP